MLFRGDSSRRWSSMMLSFMLLCCSCMDVHCDTLDQVWTSRNRIYSGQKLGSASGTFELYMGFDGKLQLLRKSDNVVLWDNNVSDTTMEYYTDFQGDGNVITRQNNAAKTRVWKSDRTGPGDGSYFMAVNLDTSEIVVYQGTITNHINSDTWSWSNALTVTLGQPTVSPIMVTTPPPVTTPTPEPPLPTLPPPTKEPTPTPLPPSPTSLPAYDVLLNPNQRVQAGATVLSGSQFYTLTMQSKGTITVTQTSTGRLIFTNDNDGNTANPNEQHYCELQGDSNWVMRNSEGKTRWKSDETRDPTKKYQVVVQTLTETIMIFPENNYGGTSIWQSQATGPVLTPPPVTTPTLPSPTVPPPTVPPPTLQTPTMAPPTLPPPTKEPTPTPLPPSPTSLPAYDVLLNPNQRVQAGATVLSGSQFYTLTMQSKGTITVTQTSTGRLIFTNDNDGNTANPNEQHYCELQGDSNWVMRNSEGKTRWKSDETRDPTKKYQVVVQTLTETIMIFPENNYGGTSIWQSQATGPVITPVSPPPPPSSFTSPPPPPPPAGGGETTYYALADVPYTNGQYGTMENHLRAIPGDCEFAIHLGDIKNRPDPCTLDRYQKVANSLRSSSCPMFIIIGDNEFNDCPDPQDALKKWNQVFNKFDESNNWNHGLAVQRGSREGTFWFIHKRTLFIGLHLPGGNFKTCCDWDSRISSQASFAINTMQDNRSAYDGVVMFGHAVPSVHLRKFFSPVENYIQNDLKNEIPLLYMGGDDHKWTVAKNFRGQRSFWHIVVSPGVSERPLRMKVDPARYGTNMAQTFKYQRR